MCHFLTTSAIDQNSVIYCGPSTQPPLGSESGIYVTLDTTLALPTVFQFHIKFRDAVSMDLADTVDAAPVYLKSIVYLSGRQNAVISPHLRDFQRAQCGALTVSAQQQSNVAT
jgi:hypothetical protein